MFVCSSIHLFVRAQTSKMFLSSPVSSTTLWPSSSQLSFTTPPMTIMHPTPTAAPSTISGSAIHSQSSPTVTSYWWGTRPFLELAFAGNFNPYISDVDFIGLFTGTPLNSEQSAVQQTCGDRWSTSFYQWMSTAIENGTLLDQFSCYKTATTLFEDPIMACEYDVPENGLLSTVLSELSQFPFTASTPCCGQCTFTAGDVQVYHWPAATTTPSVSLLVNSEGYTL